MGGSIKPLPAFNMNFWEVMRLFAPSVPEPIEPRGLANWPGVIEFSRFLGLVKTFDDVRLRCLDTFLESSLTSS